jgi:hypothetical protein
MPRSLKPYKVDVAYSPRLSRHADVFFDRDKKDFFGIVDGKTLRADTLAGCVETLATYMNNHQELVWHPEIWVTISKMNFGHANRHEEHDAQLGFNFFRLEVAKVKDGESDLERPWLDRGKEFGEPEPEDWEIEKRKTGDDIQTIYKHHRGDFHLPYTEDAWDGLLILKEATQQASARLEELIRTGREKFLESIKPNVLLLSAPEKKR